jgi:hypothetical protein
MENYNVIGKSTEELQVKAKELGISGFMELGYKDLQKAITGHYSAKDKESQQIPPEDNKADSENQTENTETDTSVEAPVLFYTDSNSTKWVFKKDTPDAFRFNGLVRTKQEWLQDEDAMEMLVYGRSTYVQKLKK